MVFHSSVGTRFILLPVRHSLGTLVFLLVFQPCCWYSGHYSATPVILIVSWSFSSYSGHSDGTWYLGHSVGILVILLVFWSIFWFAGLLFGTVFILLVFRSFYCYSGHSVGTLVILLPLSNSLGTLATLVIPFVLWLFCWYFINYVCIPVILLVPALL